MVMNAPMLSHVCMYHASLLTWTAGDTCKSPFAALVTFAAKCRFFMSSSSRRISRTTQPSNLSVMPQISPKVEPWTATPDLSAGSSIA